MSDLNEGLISKYVRQMEKNVLLFSNGHCVSEKWIKRLENLNKMIF